MRLPNLHTAPMRHLTKILILCAKHCLLVINKNISDNINCIYSTYKKLEPLCKVESDFRFVQFFYAPCIGW